MVKISFFSHDYIEFKYKGKDYTIDLKADKRHEGNKWLREIKMIKKTPIEGLKKKYHIEEIKIEPLRTTGSSQIDNILGWK